LEISGTHDDLINYQREINDLFSAHGIPEYSIHIDKNEVAKPKPVAAPIVPVKRVRDENPRSNLNARLNQAAPRKKPEPVEEVEEDEVDYDEFAGEGEKENVEDAEEEDEEDIFVEKPPQKSARVDETSRRQPFQRPEKTDEGKNRNKGKDGKKGGKSSTPVEREQTKLGGKGNARDKDTNHSKENNSRDRDNKGGKKGGRAPAKNNVPEPPQSDADDGDQQRYEGIIRRWNDRKQYYFVQCDQLQEHFNCDVVVQKDDLPEGASIGSKITFAAMESDELKNPVGIDVEVA